MVKHIMIEDVVTAKPNITVKDAVRTLQEKHIGSIVITDNNKKCVGIFTERDAIRMIASDVSLDTPIEQVMTKNVATIGEEASLGEARRVMISHGIRHLVVVDSKGELAGLLSVRRLLDDLFGITTAQYRERVYSLGAILVDRDNPETILYRSETPILIPAADYERFGKVPNVVFSCGNVFINGEVLVYYGGADSALCLATYELNELMPRKQILN